MYDATDSNSFTNVNTWMKSIKEKGNANIEVILVGNKIDLKESRKVHSESAEKLASTYKIPFIETSAKDGTNVEKAFQAITEKILRNEDLRKQCSVSSSVKISISKDQPKGVCSS